MQQKHQIDNYQERINRVLNFIDSNLDKKIGLVDAAEQGCFSQYHFHRLFKAFLGEPLGSYVKRKRLEKAANRLIFSNDSIADIAMLCSYETSSAFSKAFQNYFKISPTKYRENHQLIIPKTSNIMKTAQKFNLKTRIEKLSPIEVIYIRTKGYNEKSIGAAWRTIIPFAIEQGVFNPPKTLRIGHALDNPDVTNVEDCEYHACLSLEGAVETNHEIAKKTLKGGLYGVITYVGSYEFTSEVYDEIFKNWLPASGYELRDGEIFDSYLNSMIDTPTHELITEIHIPIQK